MKRAIQVAVQQIFYMACIGVAVLVMHLPSLITGPF